MSLQHPEFDLFKRVFNEERYSTRGASFNVRRVIGNDAEDKLVGNFMGPIPVVQMPDGQLTLKD